MVNTKVFSLVAMALLVAVLSACSPGGGGPSATAEVDQSKASTHTQVNSWEREDLVTKSSTGNIEMPAPGLIVQTLAHLNETAIPPVPPPDQDLPTLFAGLAASGASDKDMSLAYDKLLFPTPASLEKTNYVNPPAKLAAGLSSGLAALSKSKDPAKQYQGMVGPVTAAVLWPAVRTGDVAAVHTALIHARMVLSAAAWCRTANQSIKGWPIALPPPKFEPAWMQRASGHAFSKADQRAFNWYVEATQQTVMSCANLVAKIAASLGPIAYTNQGTLRTAIFERLVAFSPTELAAMEETAAPQGMAIDETGSTLGQAFNSSEGRFQNESSGWTWTRGNVAFLDGANVYGQKMTVALASAATGTMHQMITGTQTLTVDAVERAKGALHAGTPE